jgi:hypothetical protein
MKAKAKSRIVIAWLLFITLMPIFVVKAIHHHEEITVCHSDDGQSQHPCDQCPICHFTLSPFTQSESFQVQIIIPIFNCEPIAYVSMKSYQLIYSHNLRAPPSLSTLL